MKISHGTFLIILLSLVLSSSSLFGQMPKAGAKTKLKINAKQLLKDIKFLSSDEMKGREAGKPAGAMARKYVIKRFKESGIKHFGKKYTQDFSFMTRSKQTINGVNVVGFIKGRSKPNKYIVVTAHYDHVGVRGGKIHNGADDDASGTSALFAIAKYFKQHQPKHSIIFVAFDAEEKGLRGARHFVKNLPVKKESILLNVNMDMISRSDKNELYAAGFYHYPQLKKYLISVQKKASIKLLFGHDSPELKGNDWTSQSDHGAFHREKIPFLYFGVEDHKDYHKPTDTFENIHPKFYVNVVETILMAVKSIDKNYR